jgi:hypothetical protein
MATLVVSVGLDCMVPETQDRLIAPKISQFISPEIPDLSDKQRHLVDAFVMNIDLSMVLENRFRQAVFNLARKAEDALDEYCQARDFALRHVAGDHRSTRDYFQAVRHFENCLTHLRQAVDCACVISKGNQFETDDGSVLQRAAALRNKVHHMRDVFEKSIAKDETSFMLFITRQDGSKHEQAENLAATSNIPMWLTNTGLESGNSTLSYQELAQELCEVVADAETCVLMEPPKAKPRSAGNWRKRSGIFDRKIFFSGSSTPAAPRSCANASAIAPPTSVGPIITLSNNAGIAAPTSPASGIS